MRWRQTSDSFVAARNPGGLPRGSIHLCSRCLDRARPFYGFGLDRFRELFGRAARRLVALCSEYFSGDVHDVTIPTRAVIKVARFRFRENDQFPKRCRRNRRMHDHSERHVQVQADRRKRSGIVSRRFLLLFDSNRPILGPSYYPPRVIGDGVIGDRPRFSTRSRAEKRGLSPITHYQPRAGIKNGADTNGTCLTC